MRRAVRLPLMIAGGVAAAMGSAALRPRPRVSEDQEEDIAEIQGIAAALEADWNRGDAEAFSARYADDGTFTNIIGMQAYGREAFQQQHHFIFTTIYRGSTLTLSPGRLLFLRPDVALLDADTTLAGVEHFPAGMRAGADGALHTKLLLALTKQTGRWQIRAFHNVAVQTP